MGAITDKAELAGITVAHVDERGTSSTCPACRAASQNPPDATSRVRTADTPGIATSSPPTTSPPKAAEPSRPVPWSWSTVASAPRPSDVTAATTPWTSVGPARPGPPRPPRRGVARSKPTLRGSTNPAPQQRTRWLTRHSTVSTWPGTSRASSPRSPAAASTAPGLRARRDGVRGVGRAWGLPRPVGPRPPHPAPLPRLPRHEGLRPPDRGPQGRRRAGAHRPPAPRRASYGDPAGPCTPRTARRACPGCRAGGRAALLDGAAAKVTVLDDDPLARALAERDVAFLELLYGAGLRVSEACGLRLEGCDLRAGLVAVLGKRAKTRRVPIGRPAAPRPTPTYRGAGPSSRRPTRHPSCSSPRRGRTLPPRDAHRRRLAPAA